MSDSGFRKMFEHLWKVPGRHKVWPKLLRFVIEAELARVRKERKPYVGKLFQDRDRHAYRNENNRGQHLEVVLVQRLYRELHQCGNGCLQVGNEDVLLISYNVPNQGGHRRRCADLIGLRLDGSLVVFGCKGKEKPDSPLVAVLEGLDYLGHLAFQANIASLKKDFDVWREKSRNAGVLSKVPGEFCDLTIRPEARNAVIFLAPQTKVLQ
ncbi:MAG: hypothetical protein LAO08_05585 [Acidobacteriia bacterium]|nr:hypothetical protein [Terriglobia bacterium]